MKCDEIESLKFIGFSISIGEKQCNETTKINPTIISICSASCFKSFDGYNQHSVFNFKSTKLNRNTTLLKSAIKTNLIVAVRSKAVVAI